MFTWPRPRSLLQLLFGLWLYGATMALMVRAGLGLDPWDVFHEGLTEQLPLSFGAVTAIVGAAVLLLWIPLKQRPGLGTVLNIVFVAISVDVMLAVIPTPGERDIEIRCAMLVAGVVGNGLAAALYVGANLGPGPRDGLWVAIVERSRFSVRQVRTAIEIAVLVVGFVLGGTVNFGTVFYALAIGPIVQLFLPLVRAGRVGDEAPASAAGPADAQGKGGIDRRRSISVSVSATPQPASPELRPLPVTYAQSMDPSPATRPAA